MLFVENSSLHNNLLTLNASFSNVGQDVPDVIRTKKNTEQTCAENFGPHFERKNSTMTQKSYII